MTWILKGRDRGRFLLSRSNFCRRRCDTLHPLMLRAIVFSFLLSAVTGRSVASRLNRWAGTHLFIRGGGSELDVVCSLRGKKYDVTASTVGQLMESMESQAGLEQDKQSVFFKGRKLTSPEESLEDAGVESGDTLNIVPIRKASGVGSDESGVGLQAKLAKAKNSAAKGLAALGDLGDDDDDDDDVVKRKPSRLGGALTAAQRASADKLMGEMGGKDAMESMMKQMGMEGPMTKEKIEAMIGQIKQMFDNPAIKALFEDPEILEKSRQQIMSNPMLMNAYDSMGMGDLVRNPAAFREQMEGMKRMLEDPELLRTAMQSLSEAPSDKFDQGEL